MQKESEKIETTVHERQYEHLVFLYGALKNSKITWLVPVQEFFAIVKAMNTLVYLNRGRLFYITTDHAILLQFYDPDNSTCHIMRYAMKKIMRFTTRLSAFNYIIEHIPGDNNVSEYMLNRWGNHQITAV